MKHFSISQLLLLIFLAVLLAGCNGDSTASPTALQSESAATETRSPDQPTDTPAAPTATPEPLKATINGEALTLAEYEAELARFQAAQAESGTNLATEEAATWVLDSLIDSFLLAQAAVQAGFVVDETSVQARMDALAAQLDSPQSLADWMAANGYSEAAFRQALGREMAAAWMRDQIALGVPETADQAHARQILLYNSQQAEQVLVLLQGGQDFAELAEDYDPVSGGDLGWFLQGYLFSSVVEEAAFNLQPGQYSGVIETSIGFHIVQLVERDAQHPLSPDARQALQRQALSTWLAERRSQSDIAVLLP
jgi:parvulin-like peptidyl-prolyl isomerase